MRANSQDLLDAVPNRRLAWVKLAACALAIWAFVFALAPALMRIGPAREVHDVIRDQHIDATALYYTEVPEFNDADNYMRDARRYAPRAGKRHASE